MPELVKPMLEIEWLANELENPTHNLQPQELMQKLLPIIQMKNQIRKEIFPGPEPERNTDEEKGLSSRLIDFLQTAVEHTKTGQEGTPIPGDFAILLGRAMQAVMNRQLL